VHLTPEARRIWTSVVKQWVLDDAALPTLRLGLEAYDLSQQCRVALADGALTTVTERTGVIRINPLAKLQLDAMAEYRSAMRSLGLTPIEED
jgi:phage terminase small subunit